MNHNEILSTRRKEIRKLIFIWKGLIKPNNLIYPETMEEMKSFEWLSPRIQINKHDWYFNKDAKNKLIEFTNTLYDIPEIRVLNSYNTLFKITLKFIARSISLIIKKKNH